MHPDHLGTPRLISNQAGSTVWRWDNQEAFGLTGLQEDPDADGQRFTFNLRFAGQYFDAESALHYNGFRDYDPATGRYVQGDPIGLSGGISLYGYVSGNPLSFVDPLGLCKLNRAMRQEEGQYVESSLDGAPNGNQMGARTSSSNPKYPDMQVQGANDMVGPSHTGQQGLSANLDPLQLRAGQVNATVDSSSLPRGLASVNDHGRHVSIYPAQDMNFGAFQKLLNSIPWQ